MKKRLESTAKKKPKQARTRKPINATMDPAIWERMGRAADAKGKKLYAYHAEACLEKLERDGF